MDDFQLNNPRHLKPQSEAATCPNCGAPLLSEVCQYCGTYVGEVSTIDLASEYPTVECQLASFTFFGTIFPLIFAVAPITCVWGFSDGKMLSKSAIAFLLIFLLVGIGASIVFIRNVWAVVSVAIKGVNLKGTVYGYMDDTVAYNGVNGQKIKILVYSSKGRKFIVVPLKKTNKPYPINSSVNVRIYKNRAKITVNDKYEW